MTCALCLAMSGRFNANNACCQVRLLAGAPKKYREQVYERTRQRSGATAVTDLKAQVRAEYQRQQAMREAAKQQVQAEETAKGRAASKALIQTMKDQGMHHPLRRAVAGAGRLLKESLAPSMNHQLGLA